MGQVQRVLLGLFVLCGAFTILQQLQYGMICGRTEYDEKQDDPKAKACQKRGLLSAILGVVCLAVCIVLGAIGKMV